VPGPTIRSQTGLSAGTREAERGRRSRLDVGDPRQFDHRSTGGSNAKDGVESRLNRAVCAGEVTLTAAQNAIADDWYTAETVLAVTP